MTRFRWESPFCPSPPFSSISVKNYVLVLLLLTLEIFYTVFSVSIVESEQLNTSWDDTMILLFIRPFQDKRFLNGELKFVERYVMWHLSKFFVF